MTERRAQKAKGRKRPKRWHRGQTEADRWAAVQLPEVDSGADPTTGTPQPLRQTHPGHPTRRGDAL